MSYGDESTDDLADCRITRIHAERYSRYALLAYK
jgi:hypothetical protein